MTDAGQDRGSARQPWLFRAMRPAGAYFMGRWTLISWPPRRLDLPPVSCNRSAAADYSSRVVSGCDDQHSKRRPARGREDCNERAFASWRLL